MVEIEALPGRERLVMAFKGQVLEEELEQAERELRQALPRISPRFDMISDVSASETSEIMSKRGEIRGNACLSSRSACSSSSSRTCPLKAITNLSRPGSASISTM